jgi:hypothetical protein
MKLVYIEWEDAISQSGWHDEDEIKEWTEKDNITVKEVGWIYKENKTHIVLVSRLHQEVYNGKISNGYGLLQKIPKTWIRKMKVLKI